LNLELQHIWSEQEKTNRQIAQIVMHLEKEKVESPKRFGKIDKQMKALIGDLGELSPRMQELSFNVS
jgi:hypothetical protein